MSETLVDEVEPFLDMDGGPRAARTVVLHLIDPDSPGGGACSLRLLADLISTLDSIDHRVMLVGDARHVELAQRCGVLPDGWMCPVRRMPFSGSRDLRRYVHAMQTRGVSADLIHAWSPRCAALARLAAPDIPQLTTMQVGPMPGFAARYWRRLLDRTSAPLLTATSGIARECRTIGVKSPAISLMPPAVDTSAAEFVPRELVRLRWGEHGIQPEMFIVGLLAEPITWPDVLTAVTSVARVSLSGRLVRLVVHEKSTHRIEAERFLKHLRLDELLIVDDGVAEPWRIVAGLDAALWPGPRRQQPSPSILPLLWAMAAGVAVIAECTDDARQLVDDQSNGFLIDPNDVNAASRQILHLIDDHALRRKIGEAAAAHVRECYDIAAYAIRIRHAYELLLAEQGGPLAARRSSSQL